MNHSTELYRCLEDCDIVGIRRLWQHIAPHLHQPTSEHEAEATIHRARTEMSSMRFRLRAYSHRWLVDNGYPSALPDELRPRAERMYPRIVEGVGIALKTTSDLLRPALHIIREDMSNAVADAYAEGKTEPTFVKQRILDMKAESIRRLFGKIVDRHNG